MTAKHPGTHLPQVTVSTLASRLRVRNYHLRVEVQVEVQVEVLVEVEVELQWTVHTWSPEYRSRGQYLLTPPTSPVATCSFTGFKS